MNNTIMKIALASALLAGSIQASSACMLRTPLPAYCHIKCVIETHGQGFWPFEKCYIGAPAPNPNAH